MIEDAIEKLMRQIGIDIGHVAGRVDRIDRKHGQHTAL